VGVLVLLLLFVSVGRLVVDVDHARPLSAPASVAPSWSHPFGTDDQGRDLLAAMVAGVPLTLWIGVLAGCVAVGVGVLLGVLAGYAGGRTDTIVTSVTDTLLTVPGLVVLVTVASSLSEEISVNLMALIIASLAWMRPARAIRSQVLSMRERAYVQTAKLNGMGNAEIAAREIVPNLLPYIAARFVSAVSAAVLAAIGLETLGLGAQNEPRVGMTIHRALVFGAMIRGMWWWWCAPVGFLVALFLALYLVSVGLDGRASPGLRSP
jgi:peptide/nickel transport system permease protein